MRGQISKLDFKTLMNDVGVYVRRWPNPMSSLIFFLGGWTHSGLGFADFDLLFELYYVLISADTASKHLVFVWELQHLISYQRTGHGQHRRNPTYTRTTMSDNEVMMPKLHKSQYPQIIIAGSTRWSNKNIVWSIPGTMWIKCVFF